MSKIVIDPDFTRDILESEIPRGVLELLLADQTTGRNIMWMTDGYEHLESVFDVKMGVQDEIDIDWSRSIPEIDQQLYDKYGIADYKDFIESMIKPME